MLDGVDGNEWPSCLRMTILMERGNVADNVMYFYAQLPLDKGCTELRKIHTSLDGR